MVKKRGLHTHKISSKKTIAPGKSSKVTLPKEKEEGQVRINFEVPLSLRNAFKAKTAQQGKNVKEVLIAFIKNYVEE